MGGKVIKGFLLAGSANSHHFTAQVFSLAVCVHVCVHVCVYVCVCVRVHAPKCVCVCEDVLAMTIRKIFW